MNIQQLIEKVHMYNESISEFKLTNLQYTITYNSGKIFESTINVVDSLHYNLYDLGTAQIADIVIKNCNDNGLKYSSEDSSYINYNNITGCISNSKPIILTDDNGEPKAKLMFKMILWVHPKQLEVR